MHGYRKCIRSSATKWKPILEEHSKRCENINSYISRFVQHKLKLCKFVGQIDHALHNIRATKTLDELKTESNVPVLRPHLRSLEKHATELFPLRVFFEG